MQSKRHDGWIGVDLDRTLAYYGKFRGVKEIGTPIEPMVTRVRGWLAEGREVKLLTARARYPEDMAEFIPAWTAWSTEHLGTVLPVTKEKDFQMVCLWDDRAIGVEPNTGLTLGEKIRSVVALPLESRPDSNTWEDHYRDLYIAAKARLNAIDAICESWDNYYETRED